MLTMEVAGPSAVTRGQQGRATEIATDYQLGRDEQDAVPPIAAGELAVAPDTLPTLAVWP